MSEMNRDCSFALENTSQCQPTGRPSEVCQGQTVNRGGLDVPSGVGRCLTFREAIGMAEEQVGIREIARHDPSWSILHDMCRVMAEAYMAHPRMQMDVGGELCEAGLVASVYQEITPMCAQDLAYKLAGKIGSIRHIKAYLRTALYNAVFEYESSAVRDVKQNAWDVDGWSE